MVDFTGLIKNSIVGMNDGYNQVKTDLTTIISDFNNSVQQITGSKVGIRVIENFKTNEASIFSVVIIHGGDSSTSIGAFRVFRRGYPVLYSKMAAPFIPSGEFKSKEDIEAHFAAIAADRESPVVQAVALALRK